MVIGLLVLLGWMLDFETLKRIAPGLVSMKATTALALVVSGAALVCLRASASARSKRCGRALGLLVAAIGVAVGVEWLFGGLGFDQLLFHDPTGSHPGRPSQHTAVSLLLFGFALVVTDAPGGWRRHLEAPLATAFAIAVLFAIAGYAYGVGYLHSGSEATGIALHTLLSLVLLAAGLLCLRPERGLIATTIGEDAGARMARTWLPVTVLGPLCLGAAVFGAQQLDWVEVRVGIAVYTLAAAIGLSGLVLVTARRLRKADLHQERLVTALAESEERFRRSFEDSGIGMVLVSIEDGRLGEIVAANEAFAAITGLSTTRMRGMDPTPFVHAGELPASLEDFEQLLDGSRSIARREVRLLTVAGEEVWASMTGSIVRDFEGKPTYLVVQAQDISERHNFENQLQYLADHDPLTGLFNRRRVEEELERELATARRFQPGGAVLVLDLDHFKLVNDTLGHAVGDELIAGVSQVLRRRLRGSDVIGRMGGDEFAIVLPRVSVEQACEVGRSLLEDLRKSPEVLKVQGRGRVTASVGVAPFAGQAAGVGAQDLLAQADIAMYDAKEAGRDRLTVFDPGSPRHERAQARVDWLRRIEDALDHDRFVLHAQPILALDGDQRQRFELLLRMVAADGDLVPPGPSWRSPSARTWRSGSTAG